MTDTLLDNAVEAISQRGGAVKQLINDKLQGRGSTHALVEVDGEICSIRAKEYRYDGNCSFGLEQVEEADEREYVLVSYIEQADSFYVLDAEYVLTNGSTYEQPSKKSKGRTWIEVNKSAAVPLPEYRAGNATPETLAGNNATLTSF